MYIYTYIIYKEHSHILIHPFHFENLFWDRQAIIITPILMQEVKGNPAPQKVKRLDSVSVWT